MSPSQLRHDREPLQSVVPVTEHEVAQATQEAPIAPTAVTDTPVLDEPASFDVLEENSDRLDEMSSPDSSMEQVTPVSQLSDVQPTDWAFQALQSLVERYPAIAGYPDGKFRGNRPMTRYEFAAGLNATLNKVNELIATGFADRVSKEDLETLQRLQADFAPELANLQRRVERLEAATTTLEGRQFSTTTILRGQVIFALATATGGNPPGLGETNTVVGHLTQLYLISSFTGKDLMRVGLASGNFEGFVRREALNTNMARLSFQEDLSDRIALNALDYRFPAFGDRVVFTFQPVGFSLGSVLSPNSPYTGAGQGAISRFAESSPIFKLGGLDAGVGFDWLMSDKLRLQVAYGIRNSSNPAQGLSSDHSALGVQFLYKPTANLIAGFAYVNAYSSDGRLDTSTGSFNADTSGGFYQPARIHALSATLQWRLASKLTLGAWGGVVLTDATFGRFVDALLSGSVELEDLNALTLTTTYLFSLGISDPFGRKGDLLAFLVGQPPKLQAGVLIERIDTGNSFHFEAFYRYRVSDNISITPGFFFVTNPGHIPENNDIFVAVLRTSFSF